MRIGLIDVDGHAKKKKWGATVYPNLALCKISAWHKKMLFEKISFEEFEPRKGFKCKEYFK